MRPIVTLLSDFGLADSYVAELKAVLLSSPTDLRLVDVAHQIPPGDTRAAQYLLSRTWRGFPAGTVHLVVVDPGVGSDRRAIAAHSGGQFFVGPDNGVLTPVLDGAEVVAIAAPPHASATFHGRDIFAPAALRLALGEPLPALGRIVKDPVRAPFPVAQRRAGAVEGAVLYVDRFGTLITNIPGAWITSGCRIDVPEQASLPLRRTYADVVVGEVVAYVGSGGTLEIAVRDGSAADRLAVSVGGPVTVRGPAT